MSEKPSDMTREELHALLRFYEESGLDFPVADDAFNRIEKVETAASLISPGG